MSSNYLDQEFQAYVYAVLHFQTGRFYIGVRKKSTFDIGKTYFTTSTNTEFREDFETNPHDYGCRILGTFDSYPKAVEYEQAQIYKWMKKDPKKIINRAAQYGRDVQFCFDGPMTEENKKKTSERFLGIPKSDEHKAKQAEAAIRRWAREGEREKQSERCSGENNPCYGRVYTEEERRAQSERLIGKKKPGTSESMKKRFAENPESNPLYGRSGSKSPAASRLIIDDFICFCCWEDAMSYFDSDFHNIITAHKVLSYNKKRKNWIELKNKCMKNETSKMIFVFNPKTNERTKIYREDFETYAKAGFVRGRGPNGRNQ